MLFQRGVEIKIILDKERMVEGYTMAQPEAVYGLLEKTSDVLGESSTLQVRLHHSRGAGQEKEPVGTCSGNIGYPWCEICFALDSNTLLVLVITGGSMII